MRSFQHRLLELVHKEKKQLGYKWAASGSELDGIVLAGLSAADFRAHQAELHDFNLKQAEMSAQSGASERLISYTVSRDDHPEEFAKLGLVEPLQSVGTDGALRTTAESPRELVFLVGAPKETRWYESYVESVQVLLVPFPSDDDERVEIRIIKGSSSTFYMSDGREETAVRFQHTAAAQDFDYWTDTCEAASSPVLESDQIRYSPYGRWRLQVQSQLADQAALQQVQQIQFRFKVRQRAIVGAAAGLPMFANDNFAGSEGVVIVQDEGKCPGIQKDVSPGGESSTASGGNGSGGMSAGGVAAIVLILLCAAVGVVAYNVQRSKREDQVDDNSWGNRFGRSVRALPVKLRMPTVRGGMDGGGRARDRAPTIVEQRPGPGRSIKAYVVPTGPSIKRKTELDHFQSEGASCGIDNAQYEYRSFGPGPSGGGGSLPPDITLVPRRSSYQSAAGGERPVPRHSSLATRINLRAQQADLSSRVTASSAVNGRAPAAPTLPRKRAQTSAAFDHRQESGYGPVTEIEGPIQMMRERASTCAVPYEQANGVGGETSHVQESPYAAVQHRVSPSNVALDRSGANGGGGGGGSRAGIKPRGEREASVYDGFAGGSGNDDGRVPSNISRGRVHGQSGQYGFGGGGSGGGGNDEEA
jgi:hypothetical protein